MNATLELLKRAEDFTYRAANVIGEIEIGPIADLIQRRISSKLMECEAEITQLRLAVEKHAGIWVEQAAK